MSFDVTNINVNVNVNNVGSNRTRSGSAKGLGQTIGDAVGSSIRAGGASRATDTFDTVARAWVDAYAATATAYVGAMRNYLELWTAY